MPVEARGWLSMGILFGFYLPINMIGYCIFMRDIRLIIHEGYVIIAYMEISARKDGKLGLLWRIGVWCEGFTTGVWKLWRRLGF